MNAPAVYPGFLPPTPPPTPPTPQYPVQPGYGAAPGQLPPYGYPAQYPQPAQQQAPLAQGTLDDFFNQPSTGGGRSLAFPTVGTRHIGVVTRPLGPGDVQQQTDTQRRPLFFSDGRPKFVMKVPLQMQPSAAFPDGLATWYCKGQARDELARAMAEAGAPAGPPEAGSVIDITYVGERPSGQGMNPAKQLRIVYTRPQGTPAAVPAAPVQEQPYATSGYVQVQPQQPMVPAPAVQAPPQPVAPVAAVPPPAAAPTPAPTPGALPPLSPEQNALLQRLTGTPQPQQ